jgi:hypothetical protein
MEANGAKRLTSLREFRCATCGTNWLAASPRAVQRLVERETCLTCGGKLVLSIERRDRQSTKQAAKQAPLPLTD